MAKKPFSIGDAFSLGALTSGGNILGALIRGKVAALVLGPTGVGVIAEINQAVALAFAPNTFAAGPALIEGLAKPAREQDAAAAERTYRASFTLALALAALGLPLALGLAWLALPQHRSAQGAVLVLVAGLLAAFTTQQTLHRQALVSTGHLGALTRVDLIYVGLATLLVPLGIVLFGVLGHFVAFAAVTLLAVPLFARALRHKARWATWRLRLTWDPSFARSALAFGSTTFITTLVLQGGLLTIRHQLGQVGGSELNGLFQAAWAAGYVYFAVMLRSLGHFVFPRYAAARGLPEILVEVRTGGRFMARTVVPLILVGIAVREPAVRLVYSEAFDPASLLLGMMLAGNLARAFGWVDDGVLLFQGRRGTWVLTQVTSWITLTALVLALTPTHGLVGVGWAYVVAQALQLLVTRVSCYLALGMPLRLTSLFLILGGTGGMALLAKAPLPDLPVSLALLAVATVWSWRAGLHRAAWGRISRLR